MKRLFIAFSLLITLLCISTETEAQTQRTRTYLHGRFETGDYPTQTDYRDVFATFFSRLEDSLSISVLYGVDTISNDVTLADSSTVALVTEAAVKGYIDAAAGSVTNGDKGDITVASGTWTIDNDVVDADAIATGAVGTSEIANNSVANADLATMATNTLKGNDSGGSATPQDLTISEAKTMLAIASTDVTDFEEATEDLIGANIVAGSGVSVAYDDGTGNTTITATALADGDKGDIDVTGSGLTWTIDTSAVVWNSLSQAVKDSINVGGAGIDTLWSYTALRAYTGTADAVIVKDWTYTGPDGGIYTTFGGLFYRVTSGTENGGTLIAATNGVKWERQWDGINVRPEWWVCGGYNHLGTLYGSKLTSTNGIYSDSDRIRAATALAESGKVILAKNKIYLIDRTTNLTSIEGNGSTLKLNIPAQTTLTSEHTAGTNTFVVADASGFRVGQKIVATLAATTYGGIGEFEDIGAVTITNITGNTITFSGITTATAPIGSKVGAIFSIAFLNHPNRIENIRFDGSWDKINHINYDWGLTGLLSDGAAFENYTGELGLVFENCHFENCAGTAVKTSHTKINNFTARNLGGGLFHHGNDGADKSFALRNYYIVTNGSCDSTNLVSRQITSHEEGLFTYSAYTRNVFISNVRATNVAGQIFGDLGNSPVNTESDGNLYITNCYFEGLYNGTHNSVNPKITAKIINVTGLEPDSTYSIKISNSSFVNTGDIYIRGGVNRDGESYSKITWENCDFTNVRVQASYSSAIAFNNCRFYHKPNLRTFTDFTFGINDGSGFTRTGFLNFFYCDQITVSGCKIEGSPSYNQYADYGILLEQTRFNFRVDSSGNETKLWYGTYLNAINNEVSGVSFGIGNVARPLDNSSNAQNPCVTKITIGSKIAGNTIRLEKNAKYQLNPTNRYVWGIHSVPGVEVSNNEITFPEVNPDSTTLYGIICPGVALAEKDTLRGSIVKNNHIISFSTSTNDIRVSNASNGTAYYNNILIGNVISGNIVGATNSIQSGNIKISDHLSIPAPYVIPDEGYLFKNKEKY